MTGMAIFEAVKLNKSVSLEMITKNALFFMLSHPSFSKVRLKFFKTGFFYARLTVVLLSDGLILRKENKKKTVMMLSLVIILSFSYTESH